MRRVERTSFRTKPRVGAWLDRLHPYSRGLRAFWLLNEGLGETARDLVGGLPATFSGSPFTSPSWTGGRFGNHAVQFGGSSYLLVGSPSAVDFSTGTGFTCIFAARCDTVPNFTTGQIANKGGEWSIDFEGPSVGLRYVLNGGGGAGGLLSESKAMAVGDYSIWAVTYNRTTKVACIYRDGSLRATSTLSAFGDIPASSANLALGSAGGSTPWNGLIDFIGFWDRDLNASEIQTIHAQPFAGIATADSLIPFFGETSAAATTVSSSASYAYTAAAVLNTVAPSTSVSASATYGYTAAAVLNSVAPNTNVSASASYAYTAAAVINTVAPSGTVSGVASYGYTAAAVLSTTLPSGTVSASASYGYTAAAVLSTAAPATSASASATYGFAAAAVLNTVAPANGSVSVSASYGFTATVVIATTTTVVDFVGAVQNAFLNDANLSTIDGGLWQDEIPARTSGTGATITFAGGTELVRTDVSRISERVCKFRVYDADQDNATVNGSLLATRAMAWGPLYWSGGYSLAFTERTRTESGKVPGQSIGAKPRYYFEVTLIAKVVETL